MFQSLQEFKEFAYHRHDIYVNQKYGNDDLLPYSFHLNMVDKQGIKFRHLLNPTELRLARCGCWGHDLIEDGRMSWNDIKNSFGADVADIIWGCTDSSGKNRIERHDEAYWERLTGNRLSVFVKLADRMANMLYSLSTNSSMFDKYKQEWPGMKQRLESYHDEFHQMFQYIEKIQQL